MGAYVSAACNDRPNPFLARTLELGPLGRHIRPYVYEATF